MKKSTVSILRGMHSHHVGAYFKIYHLLKDRQQSELIADDICMALADIFIPYQTSMRLAKVSQEALALDTALTSLEKHGLVIYEMNKIVLKELYVKPITRNESLKGALDGAWDEWMEYKQDNKPYKTARTELIAYNQFIKVVGQSIEKAKYCIESAISSQWQGLNPEISLRKLKNANENLKYLSPAIKKINELKGEQHDKIGRINREDLQKWIEQD